jgi:NAD(P)-dependent dehydrogenase (short-subunit alcohol dehydrogenase family)
LVQRYLSAGDRVFATVRADVAVEGATVLTGVDLQDDAACLALPARLGALGVTRLDVAIVNGGILRREYLEHFEDRGPADARTAAFERIHEQLEVNALGPLRVATALLSLLGEGSRLALVSSRRGSLGDCVTGGSYGYRMSKATANMAFVTLARDLAPRGIAVAILHPGFVQTDLNGGRGDVTVSESASGLYERIESVHIANSASALLHATDEALPW